MRTWVGREAEGVGLPPSDERTLVLGLTQSRGRPRASALCPGSALGTPLLPPPGGWGEWLAPSPFLLPPPHLREGWVWRGHQDPVRPQHREGGSPCCRRALGRWNGISEASHPALGTEINN